MSGVLLHGFVLQHELPRDAEENQISIVAFFDRAIHHNLCY